MSGSSWCLIRVFVIIFHQIALLAYVLQGADKPGVCPIPPVYPDCPAYPVQACSIDSNCPGSQKCCDVGCSGLECRDLSQGDSCRRRENFYSKFSYTNQGKNSLQSFTIECTAQPIVFEVRYVNDQLCFCGRITKANTELYDNCSKELSLDFIVVISTKSVQSQQGDSCTFKFTFQDKLLLPVTLRISPGRLVTSSHVIAKTVTKASVLTRFFTSYITSTIFLTSSHVINQSTTTSRQISSAVINQKQNASSRIKITGSGNVITPTSNPPILQPTVSSIRHSSVPRVLQISVFLTPSLATKPTVLTTSSLRKTPAPNTSTFIQASPTTSVLLPRNTVSGLQKLKEVPSVILSGNTYYESVLRMWIGSKSTWKLCWRATRDGWAAKTFHSNCDYKNRTVTLVKVGQYIFGGYATASWEGSLLWKQAKGSFIFSLRNKENLPPFMAPLKDENTQHAIYADHRYGPIFGRGHDLYIADNAIWNNPSHSSTYFNTTYQAPSVIRGKVNEILAGTTPFSPSEVEVFYLV